MYTSGTTAMPKGCVLPHEALVRPGVRHARPLPAHRRATACGTRCRCFTSPRCCPCTPACSRARRYVAMRHFDPAAALGQMERERCTIAFPAFETVWLAVINHPDFASTDLSAHAARAQRRHARARCEQMQATLPWATQISSYGCTELGGVCASGTSRTRPRCARRRAAARSRAWRCRIVDPETGGGRCRPARSARSSAAATRCSAATTSEPGADGAGRRRGRLVPHRRPRRARRGRPVSYRGRLKDMLKVGGENVARGRDRGPPGDASRGRDRAGRRRPRRPLQRGAGRVRAAARRAPTADARRS